MTPLKYKYSTFQELHNSTFNLYSIFDILPPTKSAITSKLLEEVGEAIHELYSDNPRNLAEELADVIVCVLGMAIAGNVGFLELTDAMLAVANKNNAKTHETHEVVNGTIVKRSNDNGR